LTPLYAPDVRKVENWSKVILQVFEIYHRKLFHLQSKSQTYLEKGGPVKVGRHAEKTIDLKRRGQQELEMFNSGEDGDDVELVMENNTHGRNRNFTDFTTSLANKDGKTGPHKLMRPLRLTRPRKKANKDEDIEKNAGYLEENDDCMVETEDKGSQVVFSAADKEDAELADYLGGGADYVGGGNKENQPEGVLEEKIVQDRHTPEILIEEDSDIFPKSPIRKPAPRQSGKVSQGGEKPEKKIHFDHKALRKRVTKSENNESGTANSRNESTKLKRHHSDISTASSDSTSRQEEDFIQELAKKDRQMKAGTSHPSNSPEIMINPHGDVYATQMCAMEEKHSNTFEENEKMLDTQMTENYFDVGDDSGRINPDSFVTSKNVLKENSKSVDETENKLVDCSVGEIVANDSDEEVTFDVKSQGGENAQKKNSRKSPDGEVKLNIKRRYGPPSKARKFQIPDPEDDPSDLTSGEVEVMVEDVKVESDDEWLSVGRWTKDKPTTKTYSKRTRPPPRTKTKEDSPKPLPKVCMLVRFHIYFNGAVFSH
jgi:hypothetical protein